jgi:hypothetical protein
MGRSQPEVTCKVIRFVPKPHAAAYLTPFDRMEIHRWREHARQFGYDRMIIHDREPGDFADMGNFLSLYRAGESWSRWVFARKASIVSVWCSLTGLDRGEFPSLEAAFQSVMPVGCGRRPPGPETSYSNVITDFLPRLRRAAGA